LEANRNSPNPSAGGYRSSDRLAAGITGTGGGSVACANVGVADPKSVSFRVPARLEALREGTNA
jgi:hypothetical protein